MSIEARRHAPRVLLSETAYVNLGSGNKGVVLDVSEGGLRFKTAAPVEQGRSIRFQLAGSRGIDGTAEVAWTDESGTTGGLRFTTVPPEIRQQIRDWIERAASGDPKRQAAIAALQKEERDLDSLLIESSLAGTHEPSSDVSYASASLKDERSEDSVSYPGQVAVLSGEKSRAALLHQQRASATGADNRLSMFPSESTSTASSAPKRHPVAVTVLVLLVLLGGAVIGGEYFYPNQARAWMSDAQDRVAKLFHIDHKQPIGDVEPASMAGASRFEGSFEPGKPPENASVPPATPPVPAAPPQIKADAPADTDHPSDPSSATSGSIAQIPAPKTNAETEYELAQTYLAKGSSPDQQAKAVELLWLATEKGNVDAEMQLADLYSTGQAVQKSCVQARILLKAAAASNPGVAKPKLNALDQSGCN